MWKKRTITHCKATTQSHYYSVLKVSLCAWFEGEGPTFETAAEVAHYLYY